MHSAQVHRGGRRTIGLLLLASLAAGCSTVRLYDGPELPAERAAFVMLGGKWSITHATGSQLLWVDGHGIEAPIYRVAVAPGCHRIDYQLRPRCYGRGLAPGQTAVRVSSGAGTL